MLLNLAYALWAAMVANRRRQPMIQLVGETAWCRAGTESTTTGALCVP
ncbi:hypothetical protein MLPF_1491 [Mycobacterium lepromatosis]|nr:hypothetical protein MLPF_1491 [Mycobacterium lepromatosis]